MQQPTKCLFSTENQLLKNDEISLQTDERKASEIVNTRKTTHFWALKYIFNKTSDYQRLTIFIEKQSSETFIPKRPKTIFDALKA